MSEWGTFSVDRGIFTHPVFADEPFTEREAWLWLIGNAAFKAHERRVGRARVALARGQLAHATRFMAEKWKWSRASVRRFLDKLVEEKMIGLATDGPDLTQITICNYEDYQPDIAQSGPQEAQNRPKEEERKKDLNGRDARARATQTVSARVSPEAYKLTDEFLIAIHVDPKNPELHGMCGTAYTADMWIKRGYWPSIWLIAKAAELYARYGPGKPLSFYTKCFESEHRRQQVEPQLPLMRIVAGGNHATFQRKPSPTDVVNRLIDEYQRAEDGNGSNSQDITRLG